MSQATLLQTEFLAGASSLASLPESGLPEVAFVGRSNVGKSTLINRITRRKSLARTSSTPGRTQELNFFASALRGSQGAPIELLLVDLPGFGYAKFSKQKREDLSRLTVEYLVQREQLEVICLLNDCRRKPEEEELAIRNLAFEHGRHLLVVATKLDKIKRGQREKHLKQLAGHYGLESDDLVPEGEKLGPSKLLWRIENLLRLEC